MSRIAPGPRGIGKSGGSGRKAAGITGIVVGLIVLVVIPMVVYLMTSSKAANRTTLASPDIVHAVTHIPQSTFNAVGIGSTTGSTPVFPPERTSTSTTLKSAGKPLIVYEGADYCPYCATERWALVAALSKFGTFSHLGATASSSTDVYANTPSFSFYKSSYSSPYLNFQGVEEQTTTGKPLQAPTKLQQSLYNSYERVPYIPKPNSGGIPFVDFANRFVIIGVSYSPQVLRTSANTPLPMGTIAGSLADPALAPAQSVDAATNYMVGALCTVTHDQPASVCSTQAATEAKRVLNLEPPAGSKIAGASGHSGTPTAG